MLSNFSIPDKTLNKSFELVWFWFFFLIFFCCVGRFFFVVVVFLFSLYFLYFGVQSMAEFSSSGGLGPDLGAGAGPGWLAQLEVLGRVCCSKAWTWTLP